MYDSSTFVYSNSAVLSNFPPNLLSPFISCFFESADLTNFFSDNKYGLQSKDNFA